MQFDVVTLFPEMFRGLTDWGITSRAVKQERFGLRTWNPRDFTTDNYRTVDDRPYGGGPGMVMLARPLEDAIAAAKAAQAQQGIAGTRVVMMSPQGATLNHDRVMRFAQEPGLVLLCGRYEAIDQRLIDRVVDEEVSLGDFVLSGGELPAMALIDAVVRQLPGVLNDSQSRSDRAGAQEQDVEPCRRGMARKSREGGIESAVVFARLRADKRDTKAAPALRGRRQM